MRFWDTSAIVPLVLEQESSDQVRRVLESDDGMVAWWGAAVECASATARLRREGRLTAIEEGQVLALLGRLRESWHEVQPSNEVRTEAMRLVRVHPLRAAAALQLAAARVWAGASGDGAVVTLDERMALAARLEGFRVGPD